MGSGAVRGGQERKAAHFPEVQGHRWVKGLGRVLTPGNQIEGVIGSEISRGNRAQAPGFQFKPTGS